MKNYNIEGGIDFYSELYKLLDVEESNFKTDDDKNLCLITNQPLLNNFVEMCCGHKFNYIPLYKDLVNHKQKFNSMEGNVGRLNDNEIRCPYCRKKEKGVLPYYEELGLIKVTGVNTIDPNYKSHKTQSDYHYKKCEFLSVNPNFDPSGNDIIDTTDNNYGNCKYFVCLHYGGKINYATAEGITNFGDEKCYCWYHKKQIITKYKKEISNNAKEEAANLKIKAKEEATNLKIKAKKEKEEEKQKIKEELKKSVKAFKKTKIPLKIIEENQDKLDVENIVLGPSTIDISISGLKISNEYCCAVLKSGPHKGNQCGCKIINDNLCKRHYFVKNKILFVDNT